MKDEIKVSCEDMSIARQIESMTLNIQGFEDRRVLAGILADNGYIVQIKESTDISNFKSTYRLYVREE